MTPSERCAKSSPASGTNTERLSRILMLLRDRLSRTRKPSRNCKKQSRERQKKPQLKRQLRMRKPKSSNLRKLRLKLVMLRKIRKRRRRQSSLSSKSVRLLTSNRHSLSLKKAQMGKLLKEGFVSIVKLSRVKGLLSEDLLIPSTKTRVRSMPSKVV